MFRPALITLIVIVGAGFALSGTRAFARSEQTLFVDPPAPVSNEAPVPEPTHAVETPADATAASDLSAELARREHAIAEMNAVNPMSEHYGKGPGVHVLSPMQSRILEYGFNSPAARAMQSLINGTETKPWENRALQILVGLELAWLIAYWLAKRPLRRRTGAGTLALRFSLFIVYSVVATAGLPWIVWAAK